MNRVASVMTSTDLAKPASDRLFEPQGPRTSAEMIYLRPVALRADTDGLGFGVEYWRRG